MSILLNSLRNIDTWIQQLDLRFTNIWHSSIDIWTDLFAFVVNTCWHLNTFSWRSLSISIDIWLDLRLQICIIDKNTCEHIVCIHCAHLIRILWEYWSFTYVLTWDWPTLLIFSWAFTFTFLYWSTSLQFNLTSFTSGHMFWSDKGG